jgi:hypothetical protein
MIIKGNRHNNGGKLAHYMMSGLRQKGERAERYELKGFGEAENILDAFRDVEVMAEATKADNALFHVQVRLPDHERLTAKQWEHTADRVEKRLGMTGQPRAVYFHIDDKTGERHMHIGFSLIDAETMKAKPLPFFKFRLKALARELENEFDITRVKNERDGPILYAATKNEQQQAQRLGVDKDAIRNAIRACWERSDCGRSFDDALASEGYILAQGTRRDYVVMDHAGGLHALGKRILDVSAGQVRARLADLDREQMPTIEQAREFMLDLPRDHADKLARELADVQAQIKAEQEYARRDPVRDEIQWQDALHRAAIAKEEGEPQFVATKGNRKEKVAAGPEQTKAGNREKEAEDQPPPPAAKPELGRMDGEIWLAYSLTETGQEFANALEDRGFILACMTEADAERLNRWERQRLKELQELQAAIHATKQPDGQAKEQSPESKTAKPTGHWMEQRGGVENLTPELRETAERSYAKWGGNKDRNDLADYVDYVQKKDEVDKQKGEEEEKQYRRYRVGELVVVNQFSGVYQLTVHNTGDELKDREAHLKDIDRATLLSATAADNVMKHYQQHRQQERREEARLARNEKHWPVNPPQHQSWPGFAKAGSAATRDERTENLKGAAAKVWELWSEFDREKHANAIDAAITFDMGRPFSIATDPKAFAARLDDKGIMFAVASKEEAERSHSLAEFAGAVGNYAPRFKEGEIVIVTEQRPEYRRESDIVEPRRVHILDQSLAEKLVAGIGGRDKLHSIDGTLLLSDNRGQQRRADREAAALDRASNIKDFSRIIPANAKDGISAAFKVASSALGGVSKGVDAIADGFASLFAPVLTPQQKREAEITQQGREAEAEATLDYSRYTADATQQRRQQENDREAERQRQRDGRER